MGEDVLRALQGTLQVGALDVALGRFFQVLVPDVVAGVVQADTFEAVVEPQRPVFVACALGRVTSVRCLKRAICWVRRSSFMSGGPYRFGPNLMTVELYDGRAVVRMGTRFVTRALASRMAIGRNSRV